MQRGEQKWVQIDVLDSDLSAQSVRLGQRHRITAGDFPSGHSGAQFKMRVLPIGFEIPVETADDFLAHAEVHDTESALALRRANWTAGPQAEAQLSAHRQAPGLQFLKILEGQARAHEVRRKRFTTVSVVCGAGNNSRATPAFFSGREESQFGIGDAQFIRRYGDLAPQAIQGESINGSVGQIEEAGNAWLSPRSSSVKLPCEGATY